MKLRRVLLVILLVGGFWFLTTHLPPSLSRLSLFHTGSSSPLQLTEAEAAPAYDAEEQNNIAVYKRVLPSVVNITSTTLVFNFFYGTVPQHGQGSGFILDKAGHVLTNFHVVEGANRGIEVMLSNKRRYAAKVVGTDKIHDLALLQIAAPDLQPVTLADSSQLSVGQKVYAIGNPFGLSGTMTRGIISSIRSIRGSEGAPIEDAIQTDAAINPGNSGGPLLNSRGEVIGINTMIATDGADQSAGIGFAIPINTAKAVLADLTRYGRVKRPSLGIVSYAVGPDLASQMGLAVDSGVLVQKDHRWRRGASGLECTGAISRPMWAIRPFCWAATSSWPSTAIRLRIPRTSIFLWKSTMPATPSTSPFIAAKGRSRSN